jgi:hypothetical protein
VNPLVCLILDVGFAGFFGYQAWGAMKEQRWFAFTLCLFAFVVMVCCAIGRLIQLSG